MAPSSRTLAACALLAAIALCDARVLHQDEASVVSGVPGAGIKGFYQRTKRPGRRSPKLKTGVVCMLAHTGAEPPRACQAHRHQAVSVPQPHSPKGLCAEAKLLPVLKLNPLPPLWSILQSSTPSVATTVDFMVRQWKRGAGGMCCGPGPALPAWCCCPGHCRPCRARPPIL